MPRKINQINAMQITKKSLPPGLHPDGNGLYLRVKPSGAAAWIYRFTQNGRTRDMGLGPVDLVKLVEAREKASNARKMAYEGIDPIEARAKPPAKPVGRLFAVVASELIEMKKAGWRNEKHAAQWTATLDAYAHPVCGHLDVAQITTEHIRQILDPIWTSKTETASRVRGRVEAVLDYATAHGYRTGDNPAAWRGHLDKIYPAQSTIQGNGGHYAALPWGQVPAFFAELRTQDGLAARALEIIIVTACRTSEVLNASWCEVDFQAGLWVIPAERTKRNRAHRLALTPRLIELLNALPSRNASALMFPNLRKFDRPLSNMSCLAVLKRMGYNDRTTTHGFRSSFKDWSREATTHGREASEAQLSHVIKDATEAAYARGDVLEKRRAMMIDWEEFIFSEP